MSKKSTLVRFVLPLLGLALLLAESAADDPAGNDAAAEEVRYVFQSPYNDIDWREFQQYRFDGHVHARRGSTVEQVVAAYAEMGYGAIAFGDGALRYPLEKFLDDPDKYDITVIPGQGNLYWRREPPWHHHTKVWFSKVNYNRRQLGFEEAMERVGRDNGLFVFAHPASRIYPMYGVKVEADWYIAHFDRHGHTLGIEVNNHDIPGSLKLFDELLKHYGADRRIVGVGNSDAQGLSEDGSLRGGGGNFGLSLLIAKSRDASAVRKALEDGRLFWISTEAPDAESKEIHYPKVTSIDVSEDGIVVHTADESDKITWIYDNQVVKEANAFTPADLVDPRQNYVRFEIRDTHNAILGSQAFYIIRQAGP